MSHLADYSNADRVLKHYEDLFSLIPRKDVHNALKQQKPTSLSRIDEVINDILSINSINEITAIPNIAEGVVSSVVWQLPNFDNFAVACMKNIKIYDYKMTLESGAYSMYLCYPFEILKTNSQVLSLAYQDALQNPWLASGEKNGSVNIWQYNCKGSYIQFDEEYKKMECSPLQKLGNACWTLDWSPNSTLLVAGGQDETVKLYECVSLKDIYGWNYGGSGSVNAIKFIDQSLIVIGTSSHNIYLFDIRQQMKNMFCFHSGGVSAISINKEAPVPEIISASIDNTVKRWDIRSKSPIKTYIGHSNNEQFIGLTNNGKYIAVGSEDDSIYIYHKDLTSPVLNCRFKGYNQGCVRSLAFHSDNTTLIGGHSMGSTKILKLNINTARME